MTIVLVLVAIGWLVFLGSFLKDRLGARAGDSVHSFRSQLTTLERRVGPGRNQGPALPFNGVQPARPGVRPARPAGAQRSRVSVRQAQMRKRRRDVLFALVGAVVFSLLLVVVAASAFTGILFVVTAGALGGYIYLLVQAERLAMERRSKVTYLASRRPAAVRPVAPRPELLLPRSATN